MDSNEPSSAGGVLVACALVVFYFSTSLSTLQNPARRERAHRARQRRRQKVDLMIVEHIPAANVPCRLRRLLDDEHASHSDILLVNDNERDQLPTIKRQYEPDAFVADLRRWLVGWYALPCCYGRGEHRIQ